MRAAPLFCAFFTAVLAGCGLGEVNDLFTGGAAGTEATGGGGAAGTAGGGAATGVPCVAGGPCPPGELCCAGAELLECEAGALVVRETCSPGEVCDGAEPHCRCAPGEKRCAGAGDIATCETTLLGPAWVTSACAHGAICAQGICVPFEPCAPGSIECSEDGKAVLQCNQALRWEVAFDCASAGFGLGCIPPRDGSTPERLAGYCMNACSVRGVPLPHEPCTPAEEVICGAYVCSEDGTSVVSDHTECRLPGAPCQEDAQCLTCVCKNGVCFGQNKAALCPAAADFGCSGDGP